MSPFEFLYLDLKETPPRGQPVIRIQSRYSVLRREFRIRTYMMTVHVSFFFLGWFLASLFLAVAQSLSRYLRVTCIAGRQILRQRESQRPLRSHRDRLTPARDPFFSHSFTHPVLVFPVFAFSALPRSQWRFEFFVPARGGGTVWYTKDGD